MEPVVDPLLNGKSQPADNHAVWLDHTIPLLTVPSSHGRGNAYHEMLSQLGHHLQDLGSMLLAHTGGKRASPASLITVSPSCCSTSTVSQRSEFTEKVWPANICPQGVLTSNTIQTKTLQAVQRKIGSHLMLIEEQQQNDKLWELLKRSKNLPPPVSPWLGDPAISGRGAVQGVEGGNDVINREKKLGPGSRNSNPSPSHPHVTVVGDRQSSNARECGDYGSRLGISKTSVNARKSMAVNSAGLGAFLSRKSCAPKNILARAHRTTAAPSSRKTVDMMRNFAKQDSTEGSSKRMLIGRGREARLEQRQKEKGAVQEEMPVQHIHEEIAAFSFQDSVVAIVILLNALVMGISVDIQWPVGWDILEYMFTAFFVGEMIYKMSRLGLIKYFFGSDWKWNMLDFLVVMIALVDLGMNIILKVTNAGDSVDLSKFTAVKMARLGRLARLVRLLRFKMFKDLKAMVTGVFAGLHVLMWAIILFFAFIFALAMVIRNVYLEEEWEYMKEAFGTTPWAMFTLFRCFTDGCSARDGTPLIVHFYERYGAYFVIIYMLVFLFVTIGLFNLIMATFVENVMESTKNMKKAAREANHQMLEGKLRQIVMKATKERYKHLLKTKSDLEKPSGDSIESEKPIEKATGFASYVPNSRPRLQQLVAKIERSLRRCCCCCKRPEEQEFTDEDDEALPRDTNGYVIIDRELFNLLIEDPQMDEMMEELDIYTSNRWELFDVLDADMSGFLGTEELVVGFMNLRGPTEKSDVVAALLSVRNTQQMIQDLFDFQEEFVTEAMTEFEGILSGVQILARFLLPGAEEGEEMGEPLSRSSVDTDFAIASKQKLSGFGASRHQPASDAMTIEDITQIMECSEGAHRFKLGGDRG